MNRPPAAQRGFQSEAVEEAIERVSARISDPKLASLFANCLPNTLDTTVTYAEDDSGRPDTFVITGDIPAMWLRDSTNQVWPYLRFAAQDPALKILLQGVLNRQVQCVLRDPYANAFYREPTQTGHWMSDRTDMRPGVHERKYELDSLCAVLRLSGGLYRATGDAGCFDGDWNQAVDLILHTIRAEQASTDAPDASPYRFERVTAHATDTLALAGRGHPARRCGLSRSPFRPSDDAASLPFLVPANAMAVAVLRPLAAILRDVCHRPDAAGEAEALAGEINDALCQHAVIDHPRHDQIYAYEVDGFGSHYCMDDANVPSLLSLPYLGFCPPDDPVYQNTRAFVLSTDNPYYAEGKAASGVGGPHVGLGWIWPMSLIMRALTSRSDDEITLCLRQLVATDAGTGFMHETFWKDDPAQFTRPWFAWANTLFGELILTLDEERPRILQEFPVQAREGLVSS